MRPWTQILVRSEVAPLTLLHAIQKQLAAVNPEQQTFSEVEDLESWIADHQAWQQEHLAAWIFAAFAGLALALAAVGLYSAASYSVAQRTNEFADLIGAGGETRTRAADCVCLDDGGRGERYRGGPGVGDRAEYRGAEVGARECV